ncbi:DNA-binding response regulator [Saccharospirillum sp. MSK14-1]|uniref:response regulator transcription factor n=1 Tax=Saccharospirillum sp. MSK14-1 TaxID=1897632 RepID=UPI000D337B4E|nr:response regulator transcription factor [Saccharospirillum sp. MSK14-1]PTY37989.1 DNA-binding response regulator [Saccharospirillum sp. MSK14-1]
MTDRNDIVLVVDDSPDALGLIHDALENAGLDVLLALEGKQALTIAKRIRPDIILMDAVMPNMDGFTACETLKADPALASIPVIFMTGLTDTDDIVRGLESGGVDYLTKPINPNELLARMRVHLNNARLTTSAQTALDRTGQNLLTASQDGQIRWATPQTYALFARAGANDDWLSRDLAPRLSDWLNHQPEPGHSLALEHPEYPLSLRFVARPSEDEVLLRLIDGERASGADVLKAELPLTDREAEVLYWVANGKTNREVAQILELSPRTVNKHLEQVFAKLGVDNRTAAAGMALKKLALADA